MHPRAIGTVFAATTFLYLVVAYASLGLSTVTGYEEPVYYRYGGSLRWLYYSDYPDPAYFPPQGQIVGVVHNLINIVLTERGYRPLDQDDFLDRVDLFTFLAMCATAVLTVLAIYTLLGRARTPLSSWLVTTIALIPFFGSGTFGIFEITKPDYEPYALIIYLFSVSISAKIIETRSRLSLLDLVILGAIFAASISLKITMAILPITLLCIMFVFSTRLRSHVRELIVVGASGFVFTLIIWYLQFWSLKLAFIAARGDINVALSGIGDTSTSTRTPIIDLAIYYLGQQSSSLSLAERVVPFMPAIIIVIMVACRRKETQKLALAFMPAVIFYYWYVDHRRVASTYFEFCAFTAYALCLTTIVSINTVTWRHASVRSHQRMASATLAVLAIICSVLCMYIFVSRTRDTLSHSEDPNGTNFVRNSWAIYKAIPGRQLFLFDRHPRYEQRTYIALDSVLLTVSRFELPELDQQRREFAFPRPAALPTGHDRTIDLADYDTIVFFYPGSAADYMKEADAVWQKTRADFATLDLSRFRPSRVYAVQDGPFVTRSTGVYVTYERSRRRARS